MKLSKNKKILGFAFPYLIAAVATFVACDHPDTQSHQTQSAKTYSKPIETDAELDLALFKEQVSHGFVPEDRKALIQDFKNVAQAEIISVVNPYDHSGVLLNENKEQIATYAVHEADGVQYAYVRFSNDGMKIESVNKPAPSAKYTIWQ